MRYLAAWPRINMLERETEFNIGHLIIGGVGILLMVLGFKRVKDQTHRKEMPVA